MKKTSVYLDEDESEALKRVSASTGRAQAELIRDGVRKVISEIEGEARVFRSLGRGRGRGKPYSRWSPADLYKKVMGPQ